MLPATARGISPCEPTQGEEHEGCRSIYEEREKKGRLLRRTASRLGPSLRAGTDALLCHLQAEEGAL
jgi:hypothetical protein